MLKIFFQILSGIFNFTREFVVKFFVIFIILILLFGLVLPKTSNEFLFYRDTFVNNIGVRLGIIDQKVPISGTGSMYPTFPKGGGKTLDEQSEEIVATPGMRIYPSGFSLFNFDFFGYQIKRKDIVSFYNPKVGEITSKLHGREAGFVKRIIGLPGDEIEIREGLVFLNDEPLEEPYIARARSTFGSKELLECKPVKVPAGRLFVLGDNRKESLDSRYELGFISYSDVDHVLPFKNQIGSLDKNWRNSKDDLKESAKIRLDKDSFLALLNSERKKAGKQMLKYEPKLELSAKRRGEKILEFNDFSFEAEKSGYGLKRAVSEAGYSNILYAEIPIQGYYEAEELIGSFLEFPDSKEFLLKPEYQDVGISEVEGKIDNCLTQVIVLHFGGYQPPKYSQEVIDSYKKGVERINEVLPGWERIKGDERYDQKEVAGLLVKMYELRGIYERIYKRMIEREYLNTEEEAQIREVEDRQKEIGELQKKLNER